MESRPQQPDHLEDETQNGGQGDSYARHLGVWIVLLLFAGFYATLQMTGARQVGSDQVKAGPQLQISARYAVGAYAFQKLGGEAMGKAGAEALLKQIRDSASSQADQVLMTPVIGELSGADQAISHLDSLTDLPDPLRRDADLFQTIYATGPDDLAAENRDALISQHGWLGKLALSYGASGDDPLRREVMNAARLTFVSAVGVMGLIGMLGLAGLILLVLGLIRFSKGKLSLRYPQAPSFHNNLRLPFLEVMTLFMVVFGLLSFLTIFLPTWLRWLPFPLSLATILWPLARGLTFHQLLEGLGWTKGTGIIREAFWGTLGYIAGIPVVAVGFLITVGIMTLTGNTPMHPIAEQFQGAGWMRFLGLFLLACVAAPIIEETMFRGAFYHYLRGWRGPVFSGLLTGLIFAAIHPQGFAAIPVLASLGAVLALIREWRGSLIGSMVAHGLNNFVVLSMGVLMAG